jgi:hypothetical protein
VAVSVISVAPCVADPLVCPCVCARWCSITCKKKYPLTKKVIKQLALNILQVCYLWFTCYML